MSKKMVFDGLIKRHPDGFGFFIPDQKDQPDAFLPKNQMNGLMSFDRVRARLIPEGGGKFRGQIEEILERKTKTVVGTLTLEKNRSYIRDPDAAWGANLTILENKSGAQNNQLVVAEITTYPDAREGFTGKIISVLGKPSEAKHDVLRTAYTFQLPIEFSPEAIKQGQGFSSDVPEKDFQGRLDLRNLPLVTIDGATAKDFDDAILVNRTKSGFSLIVAIADVSHYVKPGSPIDADAYERGTSAYFPNFVIPMLPEILSNELCSLKPRVPRLAMTCEIHFDRLGKKKKVNFANAVIQSWERLTYGEAQEILDGKKADHDTKVIESVLAAGELAKILLANRQENGSLELEIPESHITVDGSGEPVDVVSSSRLFAHRLIEEMMLSANVAVAEFFVERDFPGVFRVHAPPADEALQQLEKYFKKFGRSVRFSKGLVQKELTKALASLGNSPLSHTLNVLTLRSMSQAQYKAQNAGHFGLAFEHYTHFTSPIRRYPDLIVHRLLKHELENRKRGRGEHLYSDEELISQTTWLSACEQRAVKAERQVLSIKKARLMYRHLGEVFEGTVHSLTRFGMFVQLREFDLDGLIKSDYLQEYYGEKFIFDEDNLMYVAKRSGKKFRLGDPIQVQVANVDVLHGKIDFVFEGDETRRTKLVQDAPRGGRRGDKRDSRKNDSQGRSSRGNRRKNEGHRNSSAAKSSSSSNATNQNSAPLTAKAPSKVPPAGESMVAAAIRRFDPGRKLDEFLQRRGLKKASAEKILPPAKSEGSERPSRGKPQRKKSSGQYSFRSNYSQDAKVSGGNGGRSSRGGGDKLLNDNESSGRSQKKGRGKRRR